MTVFFIKIGLVAVGAEQDVRHPVWRSAHLLTDYIQVNIKAAFDDQLIMNVTDDIRREKISADNVYNYLILFHDAYDQLPDIWKKIFFQSFIQEIQLYPEQQENGQVLKSMKFKFSVFYNGQTIEEIRWDKENTVETVCLLERLRNAKDYIPLKLDMEDYYKIKDAGEEAR